MSEEDWELFLVKPRHETWIAAREFSFKLVTKILPPILSPLLVRQSVRRGCVFDENLWVEKLQCFSVRVLEIEVLVVDFWPCEDLEFCLLRLFHA